MGRLTLTAIALVLATAGGAAAQDTGFGAGTPESRYFRVESSVVPGRGGVPRLEGHVYNVYDLAAIRVTLAVEPQDARGVPLDRQLVRVPLDVPARGRAFFQAKLPAGATTARVNVQSFDWVPRGGGM
jgi:hypothetical protein